MKNFNVPAPPITSWDVAQVKKGMAVTKPSAASVSQRLDAAFLCRLYRSVTWFAVVSTLLALLATWSQGAHFAQRWTASFGIGALLGVGLLRSQGWLVSRALRSPHEVPIQSEKMRWALWLLVPLKYVLVMAGLGWAIKSGGLQLFAFGAGFFALQMAILAKITGWVLADRVRNVRETFIH